MTTPTLKDLGRRTIDVASPRLIDPGGREVVGAETPAGDWARTNGLPTAPITEEIPETELPIRRLSWTAAGRAPVVLYRIEGGGHGWPGVPQHLPARLIGRIAKDFDATGILLSFAREILGATPPPTQTEADP